MKNVYVLPLLAMVLLGAGCNSSTETAVTTDRTDTGTSAPVGTREVPAAPTPVASNTCANPYFPLAAGYKITYRNQSSGTAASSYSMRVTSANATRATVSMDFDSGIRSEQTYDCTDGNVQATGYVDLAAGMSGVRATAETRSVTGQLIPGNARVGSSWNSEFKISTSIGGVEGVPARNIEATVATQRTAEAQESVTVPAGTFNALKVRSSTTFSFGSGMAGLPAMEPVVGYEWWVLGKGLVKTTSAVDGQTVSSEATEIVTP